ncbi:MAG: polysaccharide biosynthesis tyrosine autokinase [Proteobacteria bacterium]|nr:polysaccharide biosynthesis tyrosine autokinase [Pseudomonadota bacterium]
MKHTGEDPPRRQGYGVPAHRAGGLATRGSDALMLPQQMGWSEGGGGGELDLLGYWRMLLKRRWSILAVLAGALALGVLVILLTTPEYRATTTLQIEREAAKIIDVQGVEASESASGDREFYETQYQLLKSRSLAERVVRSLNLGQDAAFQSMDQPSGPLARLRRSSRPEVPQDPVAQERAAVAQLLSRLEVEPVRNSRLVSVSFTSPDKALSARVANAVADSFIESTLARRFDASAYARKFLENRLAQVRQRLEASERQLVAYAQSQGIVNIPSGEGAGEGRSVDASSLSSLNDALSAAKAERIRAEAQWRQAQVAGGMTLPAVLQSSSINVTREARARLAAEYQQKLSTFKPEYPDMVQLQAQIAELDRQIGTEVSNIRSSIRNNYEAARRQEAALAAQVAGLKSGVLNLQGRSIQYTILQREVDTNRSLYDGLLQRYKEIGVAGGVGANNISIVDRAEAPRGPTKPNKLLILAIAGVLGLFAGVLLAFILENIDETVRSPEDVEQKVGLSLLGSIPTLARGQSAAEAMNDRRSPFAEAYYSAGTALSFATDEGLPRSLLVTSSRPGEGKSTTAQTLAVNFSQLGRRVLLIDADLRNPSLHKAFNLDNTAGTSNVLAGAMRMSEAAAAVGGSLWVVPCGPLPPNPAQLLARARLREVLEHAQEEYDLVIVDGPPVMGLADAALLGGVTDGVLLVIEAGGTRVGAARAAVRRLQIGRGRLLGALLTKFDARRAGYGYEYGSEYGYDYGAEAPKKLFARKRLGASAS